MNYLWPKSWKRRRKRENETVIDDVFYVDFVNAPSAPVALICEDGEFRKLRRGVKSAEDLKEEIAKGC